MSSEVIFDVENKSTQVTALEAQISQEHFWKDQERSQGIIKELKALKAVVDPFRKLEHELSDIKEIVGIAGPQDNESLVHFKADLAALKRSLDDIEFKSLLGGETDRSSAIVNINAGAGIPSRPHMYVASDSDGRTPLMFAAARDKDDICRLLLENGALINARSANGGTALMSAVAAGRKSNVEFLLGKEADASLKMKNGFTALSMAELRERTEISALLRAHVR